MEPKPSILIVDDLPQNLRVLGEILERDYELRIAGNGPDAIAAIESSAPDLIILDSMMPGMSGIEVCRRLKAHPDLKTIPVLFISAVEDPGHKVKAFREGAVDYIAKPFHAEEVLARVHTHLQLSRLAELRREIAERKRAEKEKAALEHQLQQAQKMESIGKLAGGVAHDFNNMLSVILSNAEMALGVIDAAHPARIYLTEILAATERSSNLTRQLLAFARKQPIAPQTLELNRVITSMIQILKRLIGEKIQLNWLPSSVPWSVKADPAQIDQILANLCVNARDAIDGAGTITIRTENCSISGEDSMKYPGLAPGDYVMISVSDDGCGMDGETISHIYEPFFTTKAIGKGTGLGLPTVYGAVKQNGGCILVESEVGRGTTFRICLPRHAGESGKAAATSAPEKTKRGSEVILLVEDDASILYATRLLLEAEGYVVRAASTPAVAMDIAREPSVKLDLLIADVMMPGMSGLELWKEIQPLHPRLKRLFMSGYSADDVSTRGVATEGVSFIQKPFPSSVLYSVVRELLNR